MLKADRTRQLIVVAAKECFASHGYSGASVRMVSQRADVAQGLLYRYFTDKLELAQEVLRQCLQEIRQDLTNLPPNAAAPALLTRAVATIEDDPALWRAWFYLRLEPELSTTVRQLMAESLQTADLLEAPFSLPRLLLMVAAIDGILQHRELLPDYPFDLVADEFAAAFSD